VGKSHQVELQKQERQAAQKKELQKKERQAAQKKERQAVQKKELQKQELQAVQKKELQAVQKKELQKQERQAAQKKELQAAQKKERQTSQKKEQSLEPVLRNKTLLDDIRTGRELKHVTKQPILKEKTLLDEILSGRELKHVTKQSHRPAPGGFPYDAITARRKAFLPDQQQQQEQEHELVAPHPVVGLPSISSPTIPSRSLPSTPVLSPLLSLSLPPPPPPPPSRPKSTPVQTKDLKELITGVTLKHKEVPVPVPHHKVKRTLTPKEEQMLALARKMTPQLTQEPDGEWTGGSRHREKCKRGASKRYK
jgi:hypothetical protein